MKCVLLIIMGFLLAVGCNNEDIDSSQVEEQKMLDAIFIEILDEAKSENCTNDENWSFTAIGSKACGGPAGFIIYSTTIDTVDFLNKVTGYTQAEAEFNQKWGIVSDCSTPQIPSAVICVNGTPELIY